MAWKRQKFGIGAVRQRNILERQGASKSAKMALKRHFYQHCLGMEDLDWLGYAVRMVDLLRDSDGAEVPENFTKTLELMG